MNSLVTALPGLVPIFVSAGGVKALAGVLFQCICRVSVLQSGAFNRAGRGHIPCEIPLKQRVETTKRGRFIQKSVRCLRDDSSWGHVPSQCPKQRKSPLGNIKMACNTGGKCFCLGHWLGT